MNPEAAVHTEITSYRGLLPTGTTSDRGDVRFPLSELVRVSGLSEAALARHVGLSGTTLKRAREWGLTPTAADRYAVRAGFHPELVWPDWNLRRCHECGETFAPARRGHVFCSARCQRRPIERRRKRRKYWADPDRERERKRRYGAEVSEYRRAYMRRYYQQKGA